MVSLQRHVAWLGQIRCPAIEIVASQGYWIRD